MTGARRIDQHMAAAAAGMLPDTVGDALRTRYRQLPVMLRTGGLAATYAFLLAKSDTSELGRAYRHVADGIRARLTAPGAPVRRATTNAELLNALTDLPADGYARACAEVQLLAGWLSRLAEARYQAKAAAPPPVSTPNSPTEAR